MSVRITALPELSTIPDPSQVFIPVVANGVTQKMSVSKLLAYRTAGTVKEITSSSSIQITQNQTTGRAFASFFLPGAIAAYPGSQIPDGWLLCYGQSVSRSTYVNLFSAIGVTYGVGDGRSSFSLPDLRGRAPVGHNTMGATSSDRLLGGRPGGVYGNVLGAVGGEETHVLLADETPICPHKHNCTHTWDYACGDCENGNGCKCEEWADTEKVNDVNVTTYGRIWENPNIDAPMAYTLNGTNKINEDLKTATAHKTVPPLVFFNYIIKY